MPSLATIAGNPLRYHTITPQPYKPVYTTRPTRVQSIRWRLNRTMLTTRVSLYFNCVWKQAIIFNSGAIKHLYILGCYFMFFIANEIQEEVISLHSTLYYSPTGPRHLMTV